MTKPTPALQLSCHEPNGRALLLLSSLLLICCCCPRLAVRAARGPVRQPPRLDRQRLLPQVPGYLRASVHATGRKHHAIPPTAVKLHRRFQALALSAFMHSPSVAPASSPACLPPPPPPPPLDRRHWTAPTSARPSRTSSSSPTPSSARPSQTSPTSQGYTASESVSSPAHHSRTG